MQRVISFVKNNRALLLINAVFFIIYALISFVNHVNFRTYVLDLGLYTRAVYNYAHFHFDDSLIFKNSPENLLSDHFDPILMLISPLYYLFGQYTLLVVQILFIHIGAFGIYKLSFFRSRDKKLSLLVMTAFLSFYGIFSALSFDAHTNVFGAMMVPWMFYFYMKGNSKSTFLVLVLILLCKENMSLWLIFIGLGLYSLNYRDKRSGRQALFISLISVIYFIAVTMYIMPGIAISGNYAHMHYHVLGDSFKEIALKIISHPVEACKLIYTNHAQGEVYTYYKIETLLFVFFSGGFLLFLKPQYLIMLIPVFFQKMYHNTPVIWSVGMHYNIEFTPVIYACLISVLMGLKTTKNRMILAVISLILTISVTIRLCDNTIAFTDKARIRIYQKDHYTSDIDKRAVAEAMNLIPPDAVVSAENMFVPHLIDKKSIFMYPIVKNAPFILVCNDVHAYPLNISEMLKSIDTLRSSKNWQNIYTKNGVYLFEAIEKH